MSLAFDRSEWFGFDKPANVVCRHLEHENRCLIHDRLAALGQAGCAHYDCYGAGQRISRELYRGSSWRDDEQLGREMFEAFRRLRDVHELRLLLHEASRLPLSAGHQRSHAHLLSFLEPEPPMTQQSLRALDIVALSEAVHELLRALRVTANPGGQRRLPLLG